MQRRAPQRWVLIEQVRTRASVWFSARKAPNSSAGNVGPRLVTRNPAPARWAVSRREGRECVSPSAAATTTRFPSSG